MRTSQHLPTLLCCVREAHHCLTVRIKRLVRSYIWRRLRKLISWTDKMSAVVTAENVKLQTSYDPFVQEQILRNQRTPTIGFGF